MIGAADLAGVEGVADGCQLVTPMTAHIGEGAQIAVRIPTEQYPLATHVDGAKDRGDSSSRRPTQFHVDCQRCSRSQAKTSSER